MSHRSINDSLQSLTSAVRHTGLGALLSLSGLETPAKLAEKADSEKTAREFDAMSDNLKATIDAIPDLLYDIALDGRYYAAHSSNTWLLALPAQNLVGRTVQDVMPTDAAIIIMSALMQAYENGLSQGKQYELSLPQGDLWFELSVARKSTLDDDVPRFIVLSRDITVRKRFERMLKQNEEDLHTIFALSPDGIVVFDSNNEISHVNGLFCDITGYRHQRLIGCSELEFNVMMQDLCNENSQYLGATGLPTSTKVSAPNALCQSYVGHIKGSENVSSKKADTRNYIEIIKPNYRILLHTVIELNQERISRVIHFRDITNEAMVDRMKSEFLMTAAHELRTPMTIILGYVELLKSRVFEQSASLEIYDSIHDQSKSIVGILDELLDLARIESLAGKAFNMKMAALAPTIDKIGKRFMMAGDTRKVKMQPLPALPMMFIDKEKLAQALKNCLSNAFKYSSKDSEVSMEVRLINTKQQAEVAIIIKDHGIGMTSEQLSHIFEKFYRVDTSGKIPGTGLGLSLVKEIIEYHGGRVQVESGTDGTVVTLTLPVIGN